jgi:hypothetical protein
MISPQSGMLLLRYIHAGKEDEGWSFFNREYVVDDPEELASRNQVESRQCPEGPPLLQVRYRKIASVASHKY